MLRKPLILLFAAAFTVSLVACGGDDSGSSASDEGSDSTEAPAASSDAPDSSAGGDESAATTGAPDFSGDGGGEFCSQAQGFDEVFGDEAFQSNDPADLEDQFNASQQALPRASRIVARPAVMSDIVGSRSRGPSALRAGRRPSPPKSASDTDLSPAPS